MSCPASSIQLDINSVTKRFSSEDQNIRAELQNSTDKLLNFENSVDERQNSLEESFYEKLQQNGDKLSLLSADTQRQISEIAQEFAIKSSSLETVMLDKLEHTFAESNSKIDAIELLVNENDSSLSQANTALKNEINELNGSLQLDINSVTKRFSSANQEIEKELQNIETELQNSTDKLSKFKNSVEKRQNSLEESFYEKLQQNGDKLISRSGISGPILGHVGDGNFHAILLVDPKNPKEMKAAKSVANKMANLAISLGGTCTGEHGIGIGKLDFMQAQLGHAWNVMGSIKEALDPSNIMNPGKVIKRN